MKAEKSKELKKKEELSYELIAVQQLLLEGNSQLTDALKEKDNAQVVVSQAILSSASSKLSITQAELTDIMAKLHKIKRPAEHGSVDHRAKKCRLDGTVPAAKK